MRVYRCSIKALLDRHVQVQHRFQYNRLPASRDSTGFCTPDAPGDKFIAGINDTGEQLIAGDNYTGDKFIAGDNDTGEQLSPVSMTLVITVSPAIHDCFITVLSYAG